MIFKDIKQGDAIYLFDRNDISVQTGKVTAVGGSHAGKYNNTFEMVVDITIDVDGKSQTYTFKDSNEVSYTGQIMITPNRDNIIREVKQLKSQAEDVLKNVEKSKVTIEKCSTLIADFDPIYKERKQNDERYSKLESEIASIKEMITNLANKNV